MNILKDVNLDEISISSDGKKITFQFLDMQEGDHFSTIACKTVFLFHYQNIFDNDDGFACYIGEVICKIIKKARFTVGSWRKNSIYVV